MVDFSVALGPDGEAGTADDVNPGFPFWLAGNSCGVAGATATNCPQGTTGQRMPTPPLDMLTEAGATANGFNPALAGGWDGGLPRHNLLGYSAGSISLDTNNRLDFSKVVEMAQPVFFPEIGTEMEQVAMGVHAVRNHPSFANNLNGTPTPGNFVMNGAPTVPGAPFQDPCIDDAGVPLTAGVVGSWFDGDGNPATLATKGGSAFHANNPRTYRVANVQIDSVFNKVGYHYSQERIIALWDDVAPTIAKQRPPEPLVMRFNTFDCGKILHANLVPEKFEVDDFQVRTPTDIIGQHIHLPKWDLTTNDGAANGWNYEDGTLAPGMVHERIVAINRFNQLAGTVVGPNCTLAAALAGDTAACPIPGQLAPIDLTDLAPVPTIDTGDPGGTPAGLLALEEHVPHPFFGEGILGQDYGNARTTIQRILVDPVVNVAGVDRGLGLTFSHDHYGPSTFQQIGLYSTILAEPAGSAWVHNESGAPLYGRTVATTDCTVNCTDGGPTTWQAAILPPAGAPNGSTVQSEGIPDHREFYFEMSDFQHAYEAGVYIGADQFGVPTEELKTVIVQPDPFNVANAFVAAGEPLADSWRVTVNPPLKVRAIGPNAVGQGGPDVVIAEPFCPGFLDATVGGAVRTPRPCAEAINISHSSMFVVNYRNEPVGLRVFDPNAIGPDGVQGAQAAGPAGDLALAFQSRQDRAIAQLNTSFGDMPPGYRTPAGHCQGNDGDGINCDRNQGDPITPIMRAYERDEVKVKVQVGATEEQHQVTVHGMKWLAQGSGFGRSPNSGWRNFQSHGISEQFSLQVPMNPDRGQVGNTVDYLYATDATRDGVWLGSWGILRSYGQRRQDLFELPENPQGGGVQVVNANQFNGVCPNTAPVRAYDVTAVLANDVLPNALGVTIPANVNPTDNAGGPLNPAGGTLVYNRRGTVVPTLQVGEAGAIQTFPGGTGPLNDPTAILYVRTADLGPNGTLLPNAPVEPLVLRANAGDCIEVTLRNRLPGDLNLNGFFDDMPDLAGWQDMMWVVNRELFQPVRGNEMHFFNNNLVRPSSRVGLHAQLVDYDASRDDGVLVGGNPAGVAGPVPPGAQKTYRWYAGDIRHERVLGGNPNQRRFQVVATPVEFGGTNLLSADRVKQPQKGLFGALVIEPTGATYPDALAALDAAGTLQRVPDGQANEAVTPNATRLTRAQVSVTSPAGGAGSGGDYREALAIGHKIANLRWVDGTAIANVNQNELGREGAEDAGHAGFNYGMEPSWFRFKLPPDVPFGNAGTPNSYGAIPNAHAMYANQLVNLEPNSIPAIPGVSELDDPVTPVFRAAAGGPTRMHVLNGASADRDGTFMLHGHVWQRNPNVCPNEADLGLAGRCNPSLTTVDSTALGNNLQSKYMGGEEGMGHVYGHWPILLDSAGGSNAVAGDYLYRDYAPNGNRNGQFGILRVEA